MREVSNSLIEEMCTERLLGDENFVFSKWNNIEEL